MNGELGFTAAGEQDSTQLLAPHHSGPGRPLPSSATALNRHLEKRCVGAAVTRSLCMEEQAGWGVLLIRASFGVKDRPSEEALHRLGGNGAKAHWLWGLLSLSGRTLGEGAQPPREVQS